MYRGLSANVFFINMYIRVESIELGFEGRGHFDSCSRAQAGRGSCKDSTRLRNRLVKRLQEQHSTAAELGFLVK